MITTIGRWFRSKSIRTGVIIFTALRHVFVSLPILLFWTLPKLIFWKYPSSGVRFIGRVIMSVIRGIIATPGAIWRTPMRMYRRLTVWRNWLLEKVTYLQDESAKWKTTFNILKSPYSFLRMMGLSPQMAIGLLAVGSTAGTGVIVNETVLADRSFSGGDSGVYSAPLDVPTSFTEGDNTLLVQLSTVPVGSIEIDSIDVGTAYANSALPSGESNVVVIGGSAAKGNWLEVGHLIIDRWHCTTFRIENTEAHTLNITGSVADGMSVSPVPGVIRKRAVGGGNRAENMSVENSTYDMIKIEAPTSSVNGQVDVLRISNLATRGGGCLLSYLKVGTLTIEYLTVGAGDGLAAKDLVVATSTKYTVANISENVEELVSPLPAP